MKFEIHNDTGSKALKYRKLSGFRDMGCLPGSGPVEKMEFKMNTIYARQGGKWYYHIEPDRWEPVTRDG